MASEVVFRVPPRTDKAYLDAFEAMKAEGEFVYERINLHPFTDLGPDGLASNPDMQEIVSQNLHIFSQITFYYSGNWYVRIHRNTDQMSAFDQVVVGRPDNPNGREEVIRHARLVAASQRHIGKASSLIGVANLLGPTVKEHFEAREIALSRLEKMASDVLVEMEQARRRRDAELKELEQSLINTYQRRGEELDAEISQQKKELDKRMASLEALQKELDDRAAKHARRQHYKEIKDKFSSWSKRFEVTQGTKYLRWHIYGTLLVLMSLFGTAASYFLYQSITAGGSDSLHLAFTITKQITFTALFVTTSYFFIRWNNQWFQRHANEEFHLKRLELDIDRASWFVEMAFEWKDEKGEEIPESLVERLTQGLFTDRGGDHAVEPAESLAHALLGAARFKVKLPGDVEVEYDRKGVERLIKEEKQRKKKVEKEQADKEKA